MLRNTAYMRGVKPEFKFCKKTIPDRHANGAAIRSLRNSKRMSLRRLAFEIDLTPPYLSDLELGNRNFTEELFLRAVAAIAKHKPKNAKRKRP